MKVTDLVRGQTYESTTHGPVQYMGLKHTEDGISATFQLLGRKNAIRYWRLDTLDQHFPSGAKPIVSADDCDDATALRRIYARDAKRADRRPISPARQTLVWVVDVLMGGCILLALWLGSV